MGVKADELKAELVARVQAMVRERVPAGRADQAGAFVAQFHANMPPGDLVDLALAQADLHDVASASHAVPSVEVRTEVDGDPAAIVEAPLRQHAETSLQFSGRDGA